MHGLMGGSWKRSAAPATDAEKNNPDGKPRGAHGSTTYRRSTPPRQLPTLHLLPQGSCKVARQGADLRGYSHEEATIRGRIGAVALTDRPPGRPDLGASQVLTTQVKGPAAAQEARPRPLAAITAGQAT